MKRSQQYLTLPFKKQDLLTSVRNAHNRQFTATKLYYITEGWIYSKHEHLIHGMHLHQGIDYYVPYGTKIVAPCDGYALSSFYSFLLKNSDDSYRLYNNEKISFGFGYFIQIYNMQEDRYVVLAHLSSVSSVIPFHTPLFDNKNHTWMPRNHNILVGELINPSISILVKKGEFLGTVGTSGLQIGELLFKESKVTPSEVLPVGPTYDEPHLHFEEYARHAVQEITYKSDPRDPYDIYKTARCYPTHHKKRTIGPRTLFFIDKDKNPLFA